MPPEVSGFILEKNNVICHDILFIYNMLSNVYMYVH